MDMAIPYDPRGSGKMMAGACNISTAPERTITERANDIASSLVRLQDRMDALRTRLGAPSVDCAPESGYKNQVPAPMPRVNDSLDTCEQFANMLSDAISFIEARL